MKIAIDIKLYFLPIMPSVFGAALDRVPIRLNASTSSVSNVYELNEDSFVYRRCWKPKAFLMFFSGVNLLTRGFRIHSCGLWSLGLHSSCAFKEKPNKY